MTVIRTVEATAGQRLLWLMEHYRGADAPLNVNACYRLRGPLDRAALRAALEELVVRHEALRTSYEFTARRLLQHVHSPGPVALAEERIADGDPAELADAMLRHARTRHDLGVSPLHAALLEVGPEEFVLILNIHHLSTDGWSGGVISQELGGLYRPSSAAGPGAVGAASPAWQFADFSQWQQERFGNGVLAESQRFWRRRLEGAQPPALPGTSAIRAGVGQEPGLAEFTLGPGLMSDLQALCQRQRVTTFVATLALFASVLHTRTGETDLAFASMFANRTRPELAGTVGFLANLLVLRLGLDEEASYLDVLAAARDSVLDALDFQEVPYHLVPQAQGERGAGLENILFQVAAGPEYALRLTGLEVTQISPPGGMVSRFDLEFVLMPGADDVLGQVWYDRRRFDPQWVSRLVADFTELATAAVRAPERAVAQLLPRASGGVQPGRGSS
ncbi:condensation domain-containing protein [Kitasatospora sp. GP82]|uniref:condensation domain-containing protein n=1 Tax=Kitasatospora sp. GP82 TaxID=3035089 RepID=UPI002474555F|nr:condensation domain-containing protein [Kitasatospora sp. GP82]MDH6128342.1 hypothetical protein [Kitasatospora sp. GP82]